MKKKIVILNVILVIYILSMSVGYAAFREALTVNGVASTVDFYSGENLLHTSVLRDLLNNRYHTVTSAPSGLTFNEEIWSGDTYTLTYDKSPDIVLDTEDNLDFTISMVNPTVLKYTEGLSTIEVLSPTIQQTSISVFNNKPVKLLYAPYGEVNNLLSTASSNNINVSSVISKTVIEPQEIVDATISIGIKSLSPYGVDTIKSVISYVLQGKRRYFNFVINLIGQEKPLMLIVNSNGGVYSGNTNESLYEGNVITLNTPTRKGYIFNGWTISGEGSSISGNTFTMGSKDTTITANWTPITYKINYYCNGGGGSMSSSSHTYDVSKALTSSTCYKVTAGTSGMVYKIAGWSTSSSATTAQYSDKQSVSNLMDENGTELNLYAVWANNSIFTYNGSYNVLDDGNGNWRVKLLSGGTYTSKTQLSIDVFLVGGGGGGGVYAVANSGGGGGGSGYTATHKAISLNATSYSITIGSGGTSNNNGGSTSAFGKSVSGGSHGNAADGGAGGSGGGSGANDYGSSGAKGGQFGNSGVYTNTWSGGYGQGYTTCEFGQGTTSGCNSGVTNYASGGSGGSAKESWYSLKYKAATAGVSAGAGAGGGGGNGSVGGNATANTGSGGGGGSGVSWNGGTGGSGIVVIRNAR